MRICRLATLIIICSSLFLACTSTPRPDERAGRRFNLGLVSGAQDFLDFVMEGHGILAQFGLKPEKLKLLSPANLHLMIAERKVDIGYGGFSTMANARAEGKDIIVIHGVFSPVNMVFAGNDSSVRSLSDLKGRKLGVFGGPGSTTFTFLAVIASKWYGLDLFRDVELVSAPGPALIGLLEKGDIDAALLGTTETVSCFAQHKFRVLLDLSEEYKTRQGRTPAHVTVATNEEFARLHPEILRDFLKTYKATVQYVREHPEVWAEYANSIEMRSPAEQAVLREKMGANIVDKWDSEQITIQKEYLKLVHSIVGERALRAIPEDLIRDDFNP